MIRNGFNALDVKNECVNDIKQWFDINGKDCNAVIGISGGKDSTIVAALCVEALGRDRVIGVMMPNGVQKDINDSKKVIEHLGIKSYEVNIGGSYDNLIATIMPVTEQTRINLAPRLRMATLYAVSQSNNGRVINTSNASEGFVGYCTRYGDNVGDYAPLVSLLCGEVIELGKVLDLPLDLVVKAPSDGLTGMSDEDKMGFTYEDLDTFIATGVCEDEEIKNTILNRRDKNLFKSMAMLRYIPSFLMN